MALLLVSLALLCTSRAATASVSVAGVEWRQLTDTSDAGLSWNDVAAVCPTDSSPCQGSAGGVDLTGWRWASFAQVQNLLSKVTGETVPSAGNYETNFTAPFFEQFEPTYSATYVRDAYAYTADSSPADSTLAQAIRIRDSNSVGGDDGLKEVDVAKTDASTSEIYGAAPIGVFLFRDTSTEICDNGIDDDGDGLIDASDPDCLAQGIIVNGLEWKDITGTVGLSFMDIASVCPSDGTPCNGTINGIDLTGWTWASTKQVGDLLLTLTGTNVIPSYRPYDSNFTAPFFSKFTPTFTGNTLHPDIRAAYAYPDDVLDETGGFVTTSRADPATCRDGIDNDGDGRIDLDDPDCDFSKYTVITDSSESDLQDYITKVVHNPTSSSALIGGFLYRQPHLTTPENCHNGIDDDGDGLVDAQDPDCPVGLSVRCTHDPLYPANGNQQVTITAEAIDADGNPIEADAVEIWRDYDLNGGTREVSKPGSTASLTFTATQPFKYGCHVVRGTEDYFSGWREVWVGAPLASFPAIPVLYNGLPNKKIDIVFFPDKDEYTSPDDPAFIADVSTLIYHGYFDVPWFVAHQDAFNFWIGRDMADSGPQDNSQLCLRKAPSNFSKDYSFAQAGGIVHRSACRDNANVGSSMFTVQVDPWRLDVVAHETGHAAFGFADEYCCDGGYFVNAPDANLQKTKPRCEAAATSLGVDPAQCTSFTDKNAKTWWLTEPRYRPSLPQTPDLMQETGCLTPEPGGLKCRFREATTTGAVPDPNGQVACSAVPDTYRGDPDGNPSSGDERYWLCTHSGSASTAVWEEIFNYRGRESLGVGDSERARMKWLVEQCQRGKC